MPEVSEAQIKKQWAFINQVAQVRALQIKRDTAKDSLARLKYQNLSEPEEKKLDNLLDEIYKKSKEPRPGTETKTQQTTLDEWLAR